MSKSPTPRDAVPCERSEELTKQVNDYARQLAESAHSIGTHGLQEKEFYESGILDGAIERLRGQKSATMRDKRDFVRQVLNYLQDEEHIIDWEESGADNRNDYSVQMKNSHTCVIELKGCLDGNNTNIFERPAQANEFIIWSVCQNRAADPEKNVWSGIHVRLGVEVVASMKPIDGVVVWDFLCGTLARPCPKIGAPGEPSNRITEIGPFRLPPPCIYVFPATAPSPKDNPNPPIRKVESVSFLKLLHDVFLGDDSEIHQVRLEAGMSGVSKTRRTTIIRDGKVVRGSKFIKIKRKG